MSNIFEPGNVLRVENAVTKEFCRLSIIDTGGVDADGFDLILLSQCGRSVRVDARKVKFGDGSWSSLGGSQISQPVGPKLAPSRAK